MAVLSISQILRAAADLIEPEGRWTQGAYARGKSRRQVEETSRAAVCWCTYGAIFKVATRYTEADIFLRDQVGGSITKWNDDPTRTQSEVVAKLREAADLAERQGK